MTAQPLNLWAKTVTVTQSALASGALESIPTHYEWIDDGGVKFLVRVIDNIRRKVEAKRAESSRGPDYNPFLPYEPDLFVTDLGADHVCILNKFNVVEHHLLIITRQFEAQNTRLTLADFTALAQVLGEVDGLAFYNGGWLAGASQPHKHLQVIPLPFVPEMRLPIEPLIKAHLPTTGVAAIPGVPFETAIAPLNLRDQGETSGAAMYQVYQTLLQAVGFVPSPDSQPIGGDYNLLATREWMLLVPRVVGDAAGVGVNSLGFAGAMLVKDETQLTRLKRTTPMEILRQVGRPCTVQP
jgi:sulfate adenylyltransferase (ADP) / ATP adenylyltransferase